MVQRCKILTYLLSTIIFLQNLHFFANTASHEDIATFTAQDLLQRVNYRNNNKSLSLSFRNKSRGKSFMTTNFSASQLTMTSPMPESLPELELSKLFGIPDDLWPPTRARIANATLELQAQIFSRRLFYLTFGHNCCQTGKRRACEAFYTSHREQHQRHAAFCKAASMDHIDPDFKLRHAKHFSHNNRGPGFFVWKPYLINKTLHDDKLMKEDDYLFYMDAGAYLTGPIYPMIVLLERSLE
jgi:hypothetical protein